MHRLYPLFTIFLAFPFLIRADEPVPTETVIRLQVQPTPAPRPALRYQLLPELRDMNPGNPVQGFLMCFVGLDEVFNKNAREKWGWDKWDDMPLKDLPLDKMRGYGKIVVKQAIHAARLDTPDWQVLIEIKSELKPDLLLDLTLPAIQKSRELASLLFWRLRVEIADRRFDDALVTAQTMFVLARTLGEHPSLVADLVGVAIENMAIATIDEMIGQPGSPNLFWALTDLPRPIVDLRKGLQGERIWLTNFFRKLDNKRPMTEEQLHLVLHDMKSLYYSPAKDKKASLASSISEMVKDKKQVQAARRRLIEAGSTEAMVKQFSDLQVILVDGKIFWENNHDQAIAVFRLPFWQSNALFTKSPQIRDHPFARFASGLPKIQRARARTEQRVALLRCVEALRNHAAKHDGKLPSRLEDIELPLPVDPITGQGFRYKLEAGTGHLRGSPPPGMEKSPNFNIHYEVTIRK